MMNLSSRESTYDDKTTHYSFAEFESTRANVTHNRTSMHRTTEDTTFLIGTDPLPRVFRDLVVVIGVNGFIMNGIVLKAVLSKKLKKNTSNTFLTNQVIMGTMSSLLLIIVYSYKIGSSHI